MALPAELVTCAHAFAACVWVTGDHGSTPALEQARLVLVPTTVAVASGCAASYWYTQAEPTCTIGSCQPLHVWAAPPVPQVPGPSLLSSTRPSQSSSMPLH